MATPMKKEIQQQIKTILQDKIIPFG